MDPEGLEDERPSIVVALDWINERYRMLADFLNTRDVSAEQ